MMLYLNQNHLDLCLNLDELRSVMEQALKFSANKAAINFERTVHPIKKNTAALGFMPAYHEDQAILGYKVISVIPANKLKQLNPHQGLVVLLNEIDGTVKCLMDGNFITGVRTAAVSAVATQLLSNPNSSHLAIIGAGKQAREHIKALTRIRPITTVTIYCRDLTAFSDLKQEFANADFEIQYKNSIEKAIALADILVTVTSSKEFYLSIDSIPKGMHINAVGACRPQDKEIKLYDRKALKVYLDSYSACFSESDEIMIPHQNNTLKNCIIGELGACLEKKIPGRLHSEEITLFKSVGLSIEDVYAGNYFYQKAVQKNIGQFNYS